MLLFFASFHPRLLPLLSNCRYINTASENVLQHPPSFFLSRSKSHIHSPSSFETRTKPKRITATWTKCHLLNFNLHLKNPGESIFTFSDETPGRRGGTEGQTLAPGVINGGIEIDTPPPPFPCQYWTWQNKYERGKEEDQRSIENLPDILLLLRRFPPLGRRRENLCK